MILQPLKVFPSGDKKFGTKTLKILKITKLLQAQNLSHKAFIKHILSIIALHRLHKFARKTSGMKKEILSLIKDFSYKYLS